MIPRPNARKGGYKSCPTCGIRVYVPLWKSKVYTNSYCSKECQWESPIIRKSNSKRMKIENPCYNKNIKDKMIKRVREYWKTHKPYNYIDGSSRNRKYTKKKWIKFAKEVYRRDNFSCQQCGKKGGLLNAHHILPWAGNKELRYDIDNLITLCVPCHMKLHNGGKL